MKAPITTKALSILIIALLFFSCGNKSDEYDPYAIKQTPQKHKTETSFEVKYKDTPANLKTVHMKINNSNGYDVLFDTGCSGMLISSLEVIDLIKSGTLTEEDRLNDRSVEIADGSIKKQPVYNIREVTLVDTKGNAHTLRDIKATVVENAAASILIGSAIIDNLAKKSYTVDLTSKTIRFNQ